ncbi:zinc finger CCHC domain-containing protein 7 [Syngnathus typhle]
MYCSYQDRQVLEDDLYRGDGAESEASEAISELEFHLYSQLHYSSNTLELEDGEDEPSQKIDAADKTTETTVNVEVKTKTRPASSSPGKLQQQCNNKFEKQVKKKKEKSVPKVQRPLPKFEEVIVIDSSSDIITISESYSSDDDDDNDDDDKGVCALKGGRVRRTLTSTLVKKTPREKVNDPVTLDSSSSESGSESSLSSNTDSYVVENWMILGQGHQHGDHSIELNLEGSTGSNADFEENNDATWEVSDKDREAQIFNKNKKAFRRVANRYYTPKNVQSRKLPVCFLCGNPYHMSSECPYKHCNNCGLPGHVSNSCNERSYYHKQCHRCGMTGHFYDACPEIWRQYHITTKTGPPRPQHQDNGRSPAYCYNCSKVGHFGHGCNQQRMFRWIYVATPFINYYDTMTDIKCRQKRMKYKAAELKKTSLTSDNSHFSTPGPKRKKQKISHANNGHLFDNKFERTVWKHKSSPRHKFFHDRNDSEAEVFPKRGFNKERQQGNAAKQWKPKRPVPKERPAPSQLIIDEGLAFPRGGARGEKPKKKKKYNQASSVEFRDAGRFETTPGKLRKDKHRKRNNFRRKMDTEVYPTDENLFSIPQRKRKQKQRV